MFDRAPLLVVALAAVAVVGQVVLAGVAMPALAVQVVAWAAAVAVVTAVARRAHSSGSAAARASSTLDLLDDAVVVLDPDSLLVHDANRAAEAFAGEGGAVGRRPWEVGPWPEPDQLQALLTPTEEGPATLVVPRGDRTLELVASEVTRGGEGVVVVVARDITERHEVERTLEERERRFRALAEDAAGVVYRIRLRPEPEVEYCSPQLQDLLGFAPAEFHVDPGLFARRAYPEHRPALDLTGFDHVYGEQGVHSYRIRHADGRWLWIEDHHTPEHDEYGNLVAVQGIAFDVSAKWETEAALGEAMRKHEVAAETMHRTARVERTFVQSISHELRTPMTSALGFARMLHSRRDALSEQQQDSLLTRLVANIERIEELVGQLLDFDRYARDDAEIDRTLERLDDVVGEVVARTDVGGRTVVDDLELVITMVDRRRVEQVVEALLHNVVQHTPPDTTVRVGLTATDRMAVLTVEDDGPGVAPEVADHAFDPFTQGPASQDLANPGVGLGLAMVRVAAHLHGGVARLEPVDPHGARFVVELPLTTVEAGPEHATPQQVGEAPTVGVLGPGHHPPVQRTSSA